MTDADNAPAPRFGRPLPRWTPPPPPPRRALEGQVARLEPLDAAAHAAALHAAYAGHDHVWDYLPYGPFPDAAAYADWVAAHAAGDDPLFFAVLDRATGAPRGVASYLRITPEHGVIEIGHIAFSPAMQRGRVATEALALMLQAAFSLGYRRVEWKCDALNVPSRRAAQRLGLSFEGVFRNHMVVKGRNRDSAWYAATDGDWVALRPALTAWLAPANFDAQGRQRRRLSEMTDPFLSARG